MAVTVASMQATLSLDKRGLDTGLKSASQGLKGFGSSISGAMDALAGIGAAVGIFSGVTSAIGDMISAARESVAVGKELDAVIKSTGGAAGVTAATARKYAEGLSMVTNFQDDAILSAEAMLLTFTKISDDVFFGATEATLNLAQKFGSLDSAALQVGKALNNPIKGIAALQRVGVAFSAAQKQQIKDFMAVNDIAGAQQVILSELGVEFGGLAKAAADPLIQIQNAIGEIQEMLGMAMLPALNEIAKTVLPALRDAAKATGPELGELGLALGKAFGENLVGIIELFVDLAGSLSTFMKGVNELGVALGFSSKSMEDLHLALLPLKIAFTILGGIFSILGATFSSIAFIIREVAAAFTSVNGTTRQAQQNASGLMTVWNALARAGQFLWTWIKNIIEGYRLLIATMSTPINLDTNLTPGSPTPMELGLRGISSAIKSMPALPSFGVNGGMGGMTPIAAGGGSTSTININIGGVSASTTTNGDAPSEAIRMTVQMLRQQLDR